MSTIRPFVLPILSHHRASCTEGELRSVETLAEALVREEPRLTPSETFRSLIPDRLSPGPTLHVDDLSGISRFGHHRDTSFFEDRARFRAGDGDFVATCGPRSDLFREYCEERLGLGEVEWLHPTPRKDPLSVAAACWTDRQVRRTLVRALRSDALSYVHPHMGCAPVWNMALLLQRSSRRPLTVIAPPPGLTRLVNDKVWFTKTVGRLFGSDRTPRSAEAANFATLAIASKHLAKGSRTLVVKIPSSAGGAGNFVLDARKFSDLSLSDVRKELRARLEGFAWHGVHHLLVSSWESDVLRTPSTQIWIPPEVDGYPVVEGLFEQIIAGREGYFRGSRRADLPDALRDACVDRSWLLARLFQRLGYVGRCSFDLLVTGESLSSGRVVFIECNGRWGGTSGPMTLMNRLFGDWRAHPYATNDAILPGFERVRFEQVLEEFQDELFDARTGRGRLIFYNPGGIRLRSGLDVLALGETWEEAGAAVSEEVPRRLLRLIAETPPGGSVVDPAGVTNPRSPGSSVLFHQR